MTPTLLPMNDPAPPRRRWFRFSLRTLFVLVTIFGVWLGVQVKWIRDRHEALMQYRGLENGTVGETFTGHNSWFYPSVLRGESAKAPWSIRIFGEYGMKTILLDGGDALDRDPERVQSEKRRLAKLFPEAESIGYVRRLYDKNGYMNDRESKVPYAEP